MAGEAEHASVTLCVHWKGIWSWD